MRKEYIPFSFFEKTKFYKRVLIAKRENFYERTYPIKKKKLYKKFLYFRNLKSVDYPSIFLIFKKSQDTHRALLYRNLNKNKFAYGINRYYYFKDIVLNNDLANIMLSDRRDADSVNIFTKRSASTIFYSYYKYFSNFNVYGNRLAFISNFFFFYNLANSNFYNNNFFFLKFYFVNFKKMLFAEYLFSLGRYV